MAEQYGCLSTQNSDRDILTPMIDQFTEVNGVEALEACIARNAAATEGEDGAETYTLIFETATQL